MSFSSRRDFLRASGMVVMAGAAGFLSTEQILAQALNAPAGAAPAGSPDDREPPTLVTIFLRGGADALHALVPVGDPLYYKYRRGTALPAKANGKNDKGVLQLGKSDYWGLNPFMEPLMPLISEGRCVPIINVGSPDGTRSHFSAQDNMERGCVGDSKTMHGWLNRYLELSRKPYDKPLRGISAMSLLPRSLRGSYPVLAGNNSTEQMDVFADVYNPKNLVNQNAADTSAGEAGSRLDQMPNKRGVKSKQLLTSDLTRDIITESGKNAVERIKALEKASYVGNNASYPGGQLGGQLQTIAKVIKANVGLEVAQADYDGWDHHRGQGGLWGTASNMLKHLSDCIVAFTQDLGPRMDKTMILVMSEFGRTIEENGSNGTDHGHGGMMLAVGNMLNSAPGGMLYGTWKGLQDTEYGRFQRVYTDFRAVFAETLYKLFDFDPDGGEAFPGFKPRREDFLNYMKKLQVEA